MERGTRETFSLHEGKGRGEIVERINVGRSQTRCGVRDGKKVLGKWKLKRGVVWAVGRRIILPTNDVFCVFLFFKEF